MRKLFVSLLAATAVAAGSLVASAPVQAAPNPAPSVAFDATKPPAPSKSDKKGTEVNVPAVKGYPGKTATSTQSKAFFACPCFYYAVARQVLASGESATSLAANLHVQQTQIDTARGDYHTLGEGAVQSHDGQQIVEVGVTRDPVVCGSTSGSANTCVFVYRWTNGTPSCYNLAACGGFVEYAAACSVAGTICAGDSVAPHFGTQKRVQITHSGSAWWLAYDGHWLGYYPDSLWTGATPSVSFTSGGLFQVFYEVASNVQNTCTDMGNGIQGNLPAGTSARMGSISLTGTAPGAITNNFPASVQPVTSPLVYSAVSVTSTTARGGGPGWNSAGTAVGTTGSC
jgi:hypothetical protein